MNTKQYAKQENVEGISLYSSLSGTHGAFTLSEDIKHFREIEFIFGRSSWNTMRYKQKFVVMPTGNKTACGLFTVYPISDNSGLVVSSAALEIAENGIDVTVLRNTAGSIASTGYTRETNQYLNIYKVIGYK